MEIQSDVTSVEDQPADPGVAQDATPNVEPAEQTLEVVLSAAARRSPDALIAAMCAVGVVGVAVTLIFFRSFWRLALVLGILGAFGAWAIADREVLEHGRHRRAWRALKATVGLIGMSAVFVLCLSLLAVALGMWKS